MSVSRTDWICLYNAKTGQWKVRPWDCVPCFSSVPGLVKTKPRTPNPLTEKAQLPAEYMDAYRMLQRKSRIHHLRCQNYFRHLYSYRNALRFVLPFLFCGGHFRKQMYVFSRLRLCSSKGRRKDVSSGSVLWSPTSKICCIIKKLRGWRKRTFQTIVLR